MKSVVPVALGACLVAGVVVGGVSPKSGARPRTVQVVKLRLSAEGQTLATLSTPSGTTATMAREGAEEIGLTPVARPDGIGLTVAVRDQATGNFTVVGQYSLVRGSPADVSTQRTELVVEWLDTVGVQIMAGAIPGPCSVCCVVCDGATFCACEVTTPCGHCCCEHACGCDGGALRPRHLA